MKKLLASLVLGFGLLASGAAVLAQAPAAAPAATAAAAKPADAASSDSSSGSWVPISERM